MAALEHRLEEMDGTPPGANGEQRPLRQAARDNPIEEIQLAIAAG